MVPEDHSADADVGNDHRPNMAVEALYQLAAHHAEVLAKGRIGNPDIEGLVFDKFLGGVTRHRGTRHRFPCVDEPFLEQRRLQPLGTQHLHEHLVKGLDISSKHGRPPFAPRCVQLRL